MPACMSAIKKFSDKSAAKTCGLGPEPLSTRADASHGIWMLEIGA
jgi:hypothetical protein